MIDYRIFDTLLEPVFILNIQNEIEYCNEPFANLCGLSVRKILRLKTSPMNLFSFKDSINFLHDLPSIHSPTPYQEVGFSCSTGQNGKVQLTIQPFEENVKWIVYFRDVTLEETLQKKYRAELEKKENVIVKLQQAQDELQNYSKNLEKMVQERTDKITHINRLLKALLDSLGQGFFIVQSDGKCMDFASQACLKTIEKMPQNMWLWDVFKMNPNQVDGMKKWLKTIFAEMLPFEDLTPLGPLTFPHSENKFIQIEYHPLLNEEKKMEGLVVVATDNTNLKNAQMEAEKEKNQVQMILKLVRHRKEAYQFVREAKVLISLLNMELQRSPISSKELLRLFHTLKGGAAAFSIKAIKDLCHESETLISAWASSNNSKLLSIIKFFFTQIQSEFQNFIQQCESILGSAQHSEQRWIEKPLQTFLDFKRNPLFPYSLSECYDRTFLMEPIASYFDANNEWMQDLAHRLNKELLPLEINNKDILIYPEPYEKLIQTLVHAFRNSIDHGIEEPDLRIQCGKDPSGKISVSFFIENGPPKWLHILIQDDGRGVSLPALRSKLEQNGITTSTLTDDEVLQTVFHPGISTQDAISDISGRGVGMDAILQEAQKLKGSAWVESKEGQGLTLFIRVPYLESIIS